MSGAEGRPSPALGPGYGVGAPVPPVPPLTPEQLAARAAILDADDPRDWEVPLCPCGAPGPDILLSEVDRHGLPARNVVCERCGLVRLSPRWREGRYRRFYETEYRSLYNPSPLAKPAYARWVAGAPATRERAAWVVAAAARHVKAAQPRIVEIGAGGGWNLAGLPRTWERVGYDVDDAYLAVGREAFGLDMRHGLADVALPALADADLVLLSHVVEHLPDSAATLRTIAAAMRPDALLLIEVPGIFRIHRTNLDPRSYLQNAHPFTFCAATLRDACGRAGLAVVEIDETARAACRPGSVVQQGDAHPGLAARIIAYLRRCDYGYGQYRRLGGVPVVGRYLAYGWKRAWFGLL